VNEQRQKRQMLSRRDEIRAVDWLRANKERLHRDTPFFSEVAEELTLVLNQGRDIPVTVTKANVRNLAVDADMLWTPKRVRKNPKNKDAEYKAKWRSRTTSLEARMDRLETMVHRLYVELGWEVPPEAPRPEEIAPAPAAQFSGETRLTPPQEKPKPEPAASVLDKIRQTQDNLRAVPTPERRK
jgi:hypothetical protein